MRFVSDPVAFPALVLLVSINSTAPRRGRPATGVLLSVRRSYLLNH